MSIVITGATGQLGRQDAVLDGVRIVKIHMQVLIGDLGRVPRLALAGVQKLGQCIQGLVVQCHGFSLSSVSGRLRLSSMRNMLLF